MSYTPSLRRPLRIAILAVFLFLFTLAEDSLTRQAAADQILCSAVRDNTIFQGGTANSNGIGTWFAAGKSGTEIQRGLIQFDLSGIPVGSTINSATLSLYVINAPAQDYTNTRYFWLQALQGVGSPSWGEGNSSADPSGQGQGVAAQTGDATWLYKRYNTDLWPGGQGALGPDPIISSVGLAAGFVPGVTTIPTPIAPLPVEWTKSQSTDQMLLDIKAWVDGTMPNDGWAMLGEESTTRSKRQFGSHENSSFYPSLTVTYTVPEPAAWLLCLSAGMMAMGPIWRRRRLTAAGRTNGH
jgi:hypothetical protein